MCVLAGRLALKRSQDKSIHNVFTCFVCVLTMWSDWSWWYLGESANFILIEGYFWHYQVQRKRSANFKRKQSGGKFLSVLVNLVYYTRLYLSISIHINWRLLIL